MDTKHLTAEVEKTDKGYRAVASTPVLDRQGESIDQANNDFRLKPTSPAIDRGVII